MKKNIKLWIYSFATTFALLFNINDVYKKNLDYTNFLDFNVLLFAIVMILLYFIYKKSTIKVSRSQMILSLLFSIFMIIGESYIQINSFNLIFGSLFIFLLSLSKIIGYNLLFRFGFHYLNIFVDKCKNKNLKIKNKKILWFLDKFNKHPFITSLISILIVWSIYMIAFYPIVLSPDPSFQIKMYFNVPTKYIDYVIQIDPNVFMTSHHPVIHTYLLGICLSIGRYLVNDNFGLFIYSLIQIFILGSSLAMTESIMNKNKVSDKYRFIVLLIYLLVPMYGLYSMSGVKDVIYTALMIHYVLILYDFIKNYKNKIISFKYLLYLFVVLLLLALFRNNGLYVIVLSLPFVLFYSKKNAWKLLLVFILFYGCYYSFNNVLIPSLGISGGSVREALSIPFQQTARYVKEYGEELSDDDIEIIDKVLGYDTLVERYNPEKSDPVKNEFNKDTTKDELIDYFKVWFKCFFKHPGVYFDATLNNIYGYFYPNSHKWYVYTNYDSRITEDDLVDYHYNGLSGLRKILTCYANAFPYLPIIGLLSTIGANTWLLFVLGSYVIDKKKYRYLIPLLPLFVTLLICVASPVNTYFRYTMPYIFILPTMVSLYIVELKNK